MTKKPLRYYVALGRLPEEENICVRGQGTPAQAVKHLTRKLYASSDRNPEDVKRGYGHAVLVEAVFTSDTPIKLEDI